MGNVTVFEKKVEVVGQMRAIVTTPTDFDKTKEKLPLIVFLHGAGERGSGEELGSVRTHGVPKLFGNDPDYHGLRVITLSPQCPWDKMWSHLAFPLMDYIKAFVEEYNCDEDRIAITGVSMGGFGTWQMLVTFPEYFCCGAPVCGGGISWCAYTLKGQKLRVYHSFDDSVVPFAYSAIMVEAAKANGAQVEFFPTDGLDHNCWDDAYDARDLIEWLASQKR